MKLKYRFAQRFAETLEIIASQRNIADWEEFLETLGISQKIYDCWAEGKARVSFKTLRRVYLLLAIEYEYYYCCENNKISI